MISEANAIDRPSAPVEQRLFAGPVTREKQPLRIGVEQRERKHSVQVLQGIESPFPVGFQNHFGVGRGTKTVPSFFELAAHVLVVVDLAVEDDLKLPGSVRHRLPAGRRQIDDREATVTERDAAVRRNPGTLIVWAAMRQGVAHPDDEVAFDASGERDDTNDATHDSRSSVLFGLLRSP